MLFDVEESKVEIFSSDSTRSSPFSSLSSLKEEKAEYIPCLYLPYDETSKKLIIYYHGNAEDIGLAFDLLF